MKKLIWILALLTVLLGCGGADVGQSPAIDIISTSNPANGAVDVGVKSAITVYFGQALDETTINSTNIYLTRANGVINVAGTISYDPVEMTITFTPTFPMVAGASHVLTITSAVLTKASDSDYNLSFTTAQSPMLIATNEDPLSPAATVSYNIWEANSQTGAKAPLSTHTGDLAFKPVWSPDYTKIIYILAESLSPLDLIEDGNKINIYIMNEDGSGQTNITNVAGIGQAVSQRWARDGSKIYFQYKPDGATDFNIYSMNPDGTDLTNLTNADVGSTTGARDFGYGFRISLDGLKILYQLKDGSTGAVNLHIMNVDGTGVLKLTNVGAGNIASLGMFSPDGTQIYFSVSSTHDILVINSDGTGLTNLTNNTAEQWAKMLGVFPDGTKILYKFGSDPTGVEPLYGLYTMNVDGTSKTSLVSTSASEEVVNAVISPDGSKIAYGFGDPDTLVNLFIIGADGSDNQSVTDLLPGRSFVDLIWSPDGDKFVYSHAMNTTFGFMYGNIELQAADLSTLINVTDSTVADAWLGDWW